MRREKRWIFRQEAAWRDAVQASASARSALAAAVTGVREAEAAILSAIEERGRAAGRARQAEARAEALTGSLEAARAALEARTRELEAAAHATVIARAENARERRRTPGGSITAWSRLVDAEQAEGRARRARDDAIAEVERIARERADEA